MLRNNLKKKKLKIKKSKKMKLLNRKSKQMNKMKERRMKKNKIKSNAKHLSPNNLPKTKKPPKKSRKRNKLMKR